MSTLMKEIGSDLKAMFQELTTLLREGGSVLSNRCRTGGRVAMSIAATLFGWLAVLRNGLNQQQSVRRGVWMFGKKNTGYAVLVSIILFVIFGWPESTPEVTETMTDAGVSTISATQYLDVFWRSVVGVVVVSGAYVLLRPHLTRSSLKALYWVLGMFGVVWFVLPTTTFTPIPVWASALILGYSLGALLRADRYQSAARWCIVVVTLVAIGLWAMQSSNVTHQPSAVSIPQQSVLERGVDTARLREQIGSSLDRVSEVAKEQDVRAMVSTVEDALQSVSAIPLIDSVVMYRSFTILVLAIVLAAIEWWGCKKTFQTSVLSTFILILAAGYVFVHPYDVWIIEALVFPHDDHIRDFRVVVEYCVWIVAIWIFLKRIYWLGGFPRPYLIAIALFGSALLRACVY